MADDEYFCPDHLMCKRDITDAQRDIVDIKQCNKELKADLKTLHDIAMRTESSVNNIKGRLEMFKEDQKGFVQLERFKPIELLVRLFAGLVFAAVCGALVNQVMK